MRKQVADGISQGKSDDVVLAGFVDQFGPTVLAAPTKTGFNRVAWITPFLVFVIGTVLAVIFVRNWQSRRIISAAGAAPAHAELYIDQARRETEL
jgi:cytochrome c-type biogenesis protein CcmH/NrfF